MNLMKLTFDEELYKEGYELIAGIDEAGRGPLAGPVVASCVVFDQSVLIEGLNDSKKLSKKMREKLKEEIYEKALAIGIGIIDNNIIDEVNILAATKLAMINAFNQLKIKPDIVIIDAVEINIPIKRISLIKADQRSKVVAASSIIAKTKRDEIMAKYDLEYPEYGFINHQGYPTKKHIEAIKMYGVTEIHRKTFKPIKDMLKYENT